MGVENSKLFSLLKQKLAYHGQRQSVLARNIANANTPGYKPQDLKKIDFKEMVHSSSKMSINATHNGHFKTSLSGKPGRFEVQTQKDLYDVTPNGNAVSIEEQMLKMADNSLEYRQATTLYRKMIDMVGIVVGKGN